MTSASYQLSAPKSGLLATLRHAISRDELEEANDILEKMGLDIIDVKPVVITMPAAKKTQASK